MNTFLREDPALAFADPNLIDAFERQMADLGAGMPGQFEGIDLYGGTFHPGLAPTLGSRTWHVLPDGRFFTSDPLRDAAIRQFATNALPTYPGGGPQVTVDTAMRFPNIIARALTDLAYLRFIADRILSAGTPEQVAGGAAIFQRSEGLFPDRGAEQINVRSRWPRSAWTVPDLFGAAVQKYGMETPIADESRRRNAFDELARAQRKLANAVVKFVDATAMAMILGDALINSFAPAVTWSNVAAKIIADLANARNLIVNVDLGYEADTLIVNPAQELSLLTDTSIQNVLPREQTPRNAVVTGEPVPIVGLRQILVTNQIAAGTALVLNSGVIGTIADERPLADEGYFTYNPGGGQAPLYVKIYREDGTDESIIRVARFPAMWIAEPKAVTKITPV